VIGVLEIVVCSVGFWFGGRVLWLCGKNPWQWEMKVAVFNLCFVVLCVVSASFAVFLFWVGGVEVLE